METFSARTTTTERLVYLCMHVKYVRAEVAKAQALFTQEAQILV